MCAIGGLIDYQNTHPWNDAVIKNMINSMIHRGPDQEGICQNNHCLLLHRRLTVIDEEHGKQPMSFSQNNSEYTMVYNGELYNTQELRKELKSAGYDFSGHSDTEVVLKAYLCWGKSCVEKFNGIFALGIWNSKTQELFLARDPMGVKPFFYAENQGKFIFSSELKTILASGYIEAQADLNTIGEILLMGPGRTPGCGVFKGIKELKPGYYGILSAQGLKTTQYFKLEDAPCTDTFEEAVAKTRFLVTDSIERQLISDVPIGTFLSGGLDSSIISAVAAKHMQERGKTLETFSVFYRDNEKYFKPGKFQPNSDHDYIDIMVKHLGCKNHKIYIDTEELVEALFSAVDARDLPGMADVDSSLLLFSQEIKNHVTVGLSGECADEIFGGYPWFRDKSIRESEGFPWAQSTKWRSSFLNDELNAKIDAEAFAKTRYENTAKLADLTATNFENKDDTTAKKMMHLNMVWFMQTLLDRKDRMTMYSGLEVRVPFCDKRIAQYLYTMPWAYKDHKCYEKGLLRESVQGMLPSEILWRKKSPYPKTHNPGYLNAVSQRLSDVISDPNAPILSLVKKESLENLTKTTLETPWYGQLMTVPQTIAYFLQVNYWLKKYKVKIVE